MQIKKLVPVILLLGAGNMPASSQQTAPAAYSGSVKVNYIRTWDAVKPDSNANNFTVNSALQHSRIATQYFDGLGRNIQSVAMKGSMVTGSSPVDMVSAVVYDEFGREIHKYLPFAANNTGGNTSIDNGLFKLNPFQQQAAFMDQQYGSQGETYYYGKTIFEASPLNRILESYAPGNSWAGSAGESNEADRRGVKMKYWINTTTDSVRIWNFTPPEGGAGGGFGSYATAGAYPAGELYKNVMQDEHNKQVVEFKDKEGKVILKKVQLSADADTGTGKGHHGWLCTYYIYDDLNNLRAVIQPEGVKTLAANSWDLTYSGSVLLNEQCFRYAYDERNRMYKKKVPGADSVYMVYDARDRLVMVQDGNMRADNKWMVTKYDGLNRPAETGLWISATSLTSHRSSASSSTAYPTTSSNYEELTKTFYDNYNWRSAESNPLSDERNDDDDGYLLTPSNNDYPYPQDATVQSNQLLGMVTGTKTKVLGTGTYLYSVSFYDDKARPVQVQAQNSSDGTDIITTQYSWAGQTVLTIARHEKAGGNSQTSVVITKLTYDDLGRLTKTEKKISNSKVDAGDMPGSWTTINEHEYDALGQLKKKILSPGGEPEGGPIETLNYDYNIRGWMLGANRTYVKDTASTAHWFGFDLGYDKTSFTVNGGSKSYAAAQYNGNIGGMLWKSTGDDQLRKYDFDYDAVNRLTGADFNQLTNNSFSKNAGIDFSVKGLTYDANGNILAMNQRGWKITGSETIDSLLYTYTSNSNKLLNVIDRSNDTETRLGDFRSSEAYMTALSNNKTTAATDYSYDSNGNMYVDNNKDIEYIRYNHLNLPDSIAVTGKGHIKYVYDATGNKLKKVTTEGANVTTTLYLFGNYVNDTLQFLPQEEGRIRFKKENNSLHYDYMLKDHLGNVRMVLTTERDTSFYPPATMEQSQDQTEVPLFTNIDETRVELPNDYPEDNYTEPNEYVSKVTGAVTPVGPGIVLKVMAGDKFNLRVSSWWKSEEEPDEPPDPNPLMDIFNSLLYHIESITPGHGTQTIIELQQDNTLLSSIDGFLSSQNDYSGELPKAFVSWVLFDEQFKLVASSSGFEQVGESEEFKVHIMNELPVSKNGYLYIYVSNETPNIDVYFDNLQVTHVRGPILEETHYYPFGLVMSGISSKALAFGGAENKQRFNGYEQQNKEFSDGSGLDWYDYKRRFYDNQIGRFFCQDGLADEYPYYSPYQFAGNQVTIAIDLDGLEPLFMIDGKGHLTNPMKSLLHAAFGYSMSTMNKTTWKAADFPFGAITMYRTVKYDRSLSSSLSDAQWGNLIAHEQKHRDEIGNDVVGALNWYVNYGVGYAGAGFDYEGNPAEARAYATGGPMDRLMNFGGGVALKVLQGSYDDNAKSETLNFIGLAFNLSEQTTTLNSMQDKLNNFTGSDKAKRRLERRIERQQKRVDTASQQMQEAITDTVVNTLDDINNPKN